MTSTKSGRVYVDLTVRRRFGRDGLVDLTVIQVILMVTDTIFTRDILLNFWTGYDTGKETAAFCAILYS